MTLANLCQTLANGQSRTHANLSHPPLRVAKVANEARSCEEARPYET